MQCPGFINALDSDETMLVAAFNPAGDIEYISESVGSILGWQAGGGSEEDRADFKCCPVAGRTFFRPHANKSKSVRFQNTYYFKAESGHVYTMEKAVLVTDNNKLASIVINPDGTVKSWVAAPDCFFQGSAKAIGQELAFIVTPKSRWRVCHSLENARRGKSFLNVQFAFPIPGTEGETKEETVTSNFYHNTDGTVIVTIRFLGRDPLAHQGDLAEAVDHPGGTERQMMQMQEEIQYLRDFRDNARLPMYSVNSSSEIYWANTAMLKMMGYQDCPEEYFGSVCQYHKNKALFKEMIDTILGKEELVDFPCKLIRRDGTVLDVSFNSNAYFDSSNNFVYSRCIVQDMTANRVLEHDRDFLITERERAVIEKEIAMRENEMKSQFLAVMTHEIRTPINGVIGTASLLEITQMTDEQREYVQTIMASADILLSLVHNILDISKIEKGKLEIDYVSVMLGSHIAKACSIMEARAEERDIGFAVEISSFFTNKWYYADPTRINQVMLNFLSNAIKFTHEGEVRCRVSLVESESHDDTDVALIEVIDTGIGVEDPTKLFQDFMQANAGITECYGGTGLGLSITKKLMELMGGSVGMTSELGKGTTCWAKLPIKRSPKPMLASEKMSAPTLRARSGKSIAGSSITSDPTVQPRILIVEDNKVNLKLVKRMLETLDYTDLTVAVDGREAVNMYKESCAMGAPFNLILMDCLMPIMNGWEATEKIR
jgi:PAS domain S-box-containing protein